MDLSCDEVNVIARFSFLFTPLLTYLICTGSGHGRSLFISFHIFLLPFILLSFLFFVVVLFTGVVVSLSRIGIAEANHYRPIEGWLLDFVLYPDAPSFDP